MYGGFKQISYLQKKGEGGGVKNTQIFDHLVYGWPHNPPTLLWINGELHPEQDLATETIGLKMIDWKVISNYGNDFIAVSI